MKKLALFLCLAAVYSSKLFASHFSYTNMGGLFDVLPGANQHPATSFLPPNDLAIPVDSAFAAKITEAKFNEILQQARDAYCPVIESYGVGCAINGDWQDSTVNAFAMRFGGNWVVSMHGGLARHPKLTADGFTIVVCHEIGHHIGGFAFKSFVLGDGWAATEGQSDYFATHVCLPKLWKNDLAENARSVSSVSSLAKSKCDSVWKSQNRRNLCYRIANAIESETAMIASSTRAGPDPKFERPDFSSVTNTIGSHPIPQCRMDTQLAGALCPLQFDESSIPGEIPGKSNMSVDAEKHSMKTICHRAKGFAEAGRPRCWFSPRVSFPSLSIESVKPIGPGGRVVANIDPGNEYRLKAVLTNSSRVLTPGVSVLYETNLGAELMSSPSQSAGAIQPGATKEISLPAIEIPARVRCGAVLPVRTIANSASGQADFLSYLQVGSPVELGQMVHGEFDVDNKPNVFEVEVDPSQPLHNIIVSMSVDHPKPDQLEVVLRLSTGKGYRFPQLQWSEGGQLLRTSMNILGINGSLISRGIKIEVSDSTSVSRGRVTELVIQTEKFECG